MKSIVVNGHADLAQVTMELEEVATPQPKEGEVLIKLVAAPLNPSDYGAWRGGGQFRNQGKEGAGVVVASGGGAAADALVGKGVGIAAMQGCSYQQYTTMPATSLYPLPDGLAPEDAASFWVNPYTAVGIVETVREKKSPAFIHTAAASQLGQMLVKFCKAEGVGLVNVVRREEQAETLRQLGAEHVVVTDKEGWQDQLKGLVKDLKITVAFDAIAGGNSAQLLGVLPAGSTCFVYGRLSGEDLHSVNVGDLIYSTKTVAGWLMPTWLFGAPERNAAASAKVLPALKAGWASSTFVDSHPSKVHEELAKLATGGFTNKKLRVRWDQM